MRAIEAGQEQLKEQRTAGANGRNRADFQNGSPGNHQPPSLARREGYVPSVARLRSELHTTFPVERSTR